MVTVVQPREKGGRIVYQVEEFHPSFVSTHPPIKQGYGPAYEKGTRKFFQYYRNNVMSRYMPPMYKWGSDYCPYACRPRMLLSHRKQRWEEMFCKPVVRLSLADQKKLKELDDFYLLCQFQRQYYNDYTGHVHPLDFFQKDEHKWRCAPDLNSTYIQFPEMYVKYKQPACLPLTTKRAWLDPLEPTRRLAGKYDPYPDLRFPR